MKLFQITVRVFTGDGHVTSFNVTTVLPASSPTEAKTIVEKSVKDKNTPIGSAIAEFDKSCLMTIGDPKEVEGGIYFHEPVRQPL